jgi:pyruvate dehydrogenase E2 component (dihydrolipoamide acetyltransferase)
MNVLMPQLGETVAEGKITKWFKSAGDAVKPGDNLFEIETDKVSMEVPSTSAGVLSEIRVGVGEVAPVGAIVAVIAGEGGAAAPPPAAATPAEAGNRHRRAYESFADGSGDRGADQTRSVLRGAYARPQLRSGQASRRRRRDAAGAAAGGRRRDRSRPVTGSGPHGRIVARDVQSASRSGRALVPAAGAGEVMALYRDAAFVEVPLDGMRKTIAARLIQAKQTIPHFYLSADVEIGRFLTMREEANAGAPKDNDGQPSFRLSVNDLIIKAWGVALQRVPEANAAWADDRILRFRHSDIGIAVAIDGGLITPIIRQAETKSLTAISAEMRELAERARSRRLKPHEYQGGSSAISNLGMYGVREFAAIINPPHATILAVGAARRQAVETADGGVAFASMMTVTLSCDHRVVDGALGAELLAAFKGLVETPVTMLV